MSLSDWHRGCRRGYLRSFHPCFNGCVFQTGIGDVEEVIFEVSILVLMDVSFRPDGPDEHMTIIEVSILVLMDVSFRQNKKLKRGEKNEVSILVLMDVSFRLCNKN